MEHFIQRYFRAVNSSLDDAVRLALNKLREFLRGHTDTDFADGEAFADALLDQLESSFAHGWSTARATAAIRRSTAAAYEFYRLRDATVFGDASPIRLRLGGPDRVSMEFIEKLDHFYFSKFADNTKPGLKKFFMDRFFGDGSLLFDERSTAWRDFQKAAGDRLKNLTYRQTKTIIDTATARVRNWAHIGTLDQGKFEYAKMVATLDSRTSQFCLTIDGKIIRVGVAYDTVQRLNKLEPKEFAKELYESDLAKRLRQEPAANIREYLEDDGKTISDVLVATGLGIPPFHPNCRTRMEGVIPGVDDSESEQ